MNEMLNFKESQKYLGHDIFIGDDIFKKLFNINYFLVFNDSTTRSKLILEMYFNLQQSLNNFAFFCFERLSIRKNQQYSISNDPNKSFQEFFLLCFENNCYIFDINCPNFQKNLLFLLNIRKELLLFGSRKDDISRFMKIFEINGGTPLDKDKDIIKEKVILVLEENINNEIECEINELMNSSKIIGIMNKYQKPKQTFSDILKLITFRIVMTYSIRKFYFPRSSFKDPYFFEKEKEIFEKMKKNYNNVSNMNEKYEAQEIQPIEEMKNKDLIILRMIGKGSFASISLAFHIFHEQLFIVKEFIDDEHFEKEKENYSRLQFMHPNIVKCYGYTQNSLIIEFMCNGTLQNYLYMNENSNPLIIHYVSPVVMYSSTTFFHEFQFQFFNNHVNKVRIIIEIIFGLIYLHLNDMIYCDFKPDNIFIDHNFLVRFGDFDLSCHNDFLVTESSKPKDIGTNDYFSPDILLDTNNDYSYNSDIFQTGLIIYAICTGRNLFENVNTIRNNEQLNKIIKIKSIDFSFGPFCSILFKCLKINRFNRISLFNVVNEITKYPLFFQNMIGKSTHDFYYTDIVQEIHLLQQNYHDILISFVHDMCSKIKENKSQINITQMQAVISNFCQLPSLKNMLYKLSDEIREIVLFCENQMEQIHQFKTDEKYKYEQIKATKYKLLPAFFKIYSSEYYKYKDDRKADDLLLSAAKHYNFVPHFILGLKYLDGDKFIKKDINKSILHFTISADAGYEDSQYQLGEIYSELLHRNERIKIPELGIDTNDKNFFTKQALKYYKLAKKQNSASALYGLAVLYFNGDCRVNCSKKKAMQYILRGKRQFHWFSIKMFLKFYNKNLIDYDEFKFEKEATFLSDSFNDATAQYELAVFYSNRRKNVELAKKFFILAADKNNGDAFTSLGNIYLDEWKRTKSEKIGKKAFFCFLNAANFNSPHAMFYVACRYFFGDTLYAKKDQKKAMEFFHKAASLNSPKAQLVLGYIYFKGIRPNIPSNYIKSIHYLQIAAENKLHREKRAMDILGLFHLEGQIVKKDIRKAMGYFMNGKNLVSDVSTHQLGFLYEVGEKRLNEMVFIGYIFFNNPFQIYGLNFSYIKNLDSNILDDFDSDCLKRNPGLAIQYYQECISPASQYNLAAIYYNGVYVKRNVLLAIKLLQKCAEYLNFAAYFLFLIFLNGEKNWVEKDIDMAKYYLEKSHISSFNDDLTIDILSHSRFFYKVFYTNNESKKKNIDKKPINMNFYEGLLTPESDGLIEYDHEYYNQLKSNKKSS